MKMFQMNELMMNAHRQIEMRKRAFKQDDHYAPIKKTMPMLKNRDAAIGGLYKGGLLSRNDSDKARKIASLTAQIQSKISSMANLQPPDKPTPLILDESGRTVDITGKEVQLTQVVPTLKANIRAKKREEFKAQLQESKGPEELQETQFFDNRIGSKSAVRNKRALKFHEPGKFQQLAAKIRTKAQLEKLQIEISQIARKTGISSATKLALIAPKTEALNEDVPNVEWWDSVILKGNKYPENEQQLKEFINEPAITNLVEHPAQMKPPSKWPTVCFQTLFL